MEDLTPVLRALADPTRRAILDLLRDGGLPVSDLAKSFSMSRPAVSKHLGLLRQAGLAIPRREGRLQVYELEAGPLAPVRVWLERYGPRPRPANRTGTAPRRPAAPDGWRCW